MGSVSHWELLLRIAIGTALGGVIGYERDVHGRPAGLRTHMIVGLASATFMVISTNFMYFQHYSQGGLVDVDASRIAAAIVTGMGFLAGGAILRTGLTVQGLTTAAALWMVGAIGMASGSGMYEVAVFVTLLGVLALTIVRRFEDKDDRTTQRRKVEILLGPTGSMTQISALLLALNVYVLPIIDERNVDDKTHSVILEMRFSQTTIIDEVVDSIAAQPGVKLVRVGQIA